MKQDALKSKTDPKKLLVFSFVSCFLLITNVTGWNRIIYSTTDQVLSPFVIAGRSIAFNTNILFKEISNKRGVLSENIELRRTIATYDQLRAENKDLKDQIDRLQNQTGIIPAKDRKLSLVKVVGAQNLFNSNPEVLVYLDSNNKVRVNDVVYYESSTLFGFVKEVDGKTATVVPFYSPDIKFNIPVQSLKDPSQKGFISAISNAKVSVRNVAKEVGVSVGDVWVTTNDVTEVPSTLVVGKVSNVVKKDQANFQELGLDLAFSLGTTTYLMIASD